MNEALRDRHEFLNYDDEFKEHVEDVESCLDEIADLEETKGE